MILNGPTLLSSKYPLYKKLCVCIFLVFILACLSVGWSRSLWIIAIDNGFFEVFSAVTRQSWAFDTLIVQIFRTNTAKIVPLLACIVWLLFERRRQGEDILFFSQLLMGSLLAIILSRVMQNFSTYRPRPLHNPRIEYQLPFGIEPSTLEGWSSFPSDTSSLAVSLAAGIFVVSKRLGIAAFLWAVVVVAFPRAYAGLHYPSDLIGGIIIGILCTAGIAPLIIFIIKRKGKLAINGKLTPLFCALIFIYLFQMGTMFDDIRRYGQFFKEAFGI